MSERPAVDWDLATRTAVRLAGSGPQIDPADAQTVVAGLRAGAQAAVQHVEAYTGLHAPAQPGAVAVVDRRAWVQANVDGLRTVIDPLLARAPIPRTASATGLVTIEIGAALGFLASKVLGQYELFTAPGARPRLLLVAPNVVAVQQRMDVDPRDFRLWVALHEETHRVQFGANPWLGPWLRTEIDSYLSGIDLDPKVLSERLRQTVAAFAGVVRGLDVTEALRAFLTPEQRAALDRLTAVMSLLEGHADVVMDGVGPSVLPTLDTLRARFQARRDDPSMVEAFVRRLLGLDAKLRQYRDGAAFVRQVVARVGVDGFNTVWSAPEALPDLAELHDPAAWLERMG